jgi:hypothetical protein
MWAWFTALPRATKATIICGILGWILDLSFSSQTTANGVVTSCSHFGLGAVAFGVGGLVTGAQSMVLGLRDRVSEGLKPRVIGIGIGGVAMALVHLLRGFGVILGPCN